MMMHAEEHKTQNDIFMGQHFDQAAFFILRLRWWMCPVGTAGMYVSGGTLWYQEGGWLKRKRRDRI